MNNIKGLLEHVGKSFVAVGLGLITSVALVKGAEADKISHANPESPGSAIELAKFLASDRQTVLFIHSPHCGDCRRAEPGIKELAGKRPDLKIVEIELDAKTDKGIGFDSAAAKQFDVHFVPMFVIYDVHGKETCRGKDAQSLINTWLREAHINVTVTS